TISVYKQWVGNCYWYNNWRIYRRIFIEGEKIMVYIIIIGMALVTMVPRFLPAFLIDKFVFKDWVNHWLQAIPYAALGALIFPAILEVKEGAPHIGLIGGIVAVLLAYFGLNVVFVVIGAIATVFLITL